MEKHSYSIVSMLLWLMLISGCATMQDRWSLVVNQNTRSNYENFIKEYPDSEMAKEAKKRLEDPDYAFMATCQIGTKEAFEGFVNSYPASNYVPTAKAYIEFLKETRSGDIKTYKRFIAQYPNNIFVTDAKISVPLLWLKERGNKVGVVVNIKELIHKGIFGGGYGNAEGARQRVWQTLKKELDNEEIQVVLLDSLESSKIKDEGIKEVVIADYSESYTARTPSYSSVNYPSDDDYKNTGAAGAMAAYSVQALHDGAVQNLSSIFYNPAVEVISITVKRIKDGVEYYSGFPTLSSSVGNINISEALRAICNNPNPMLTITELRGRNLSDPLIASALRGDTDSVRSLLDKGANVNIKDVHGNTALNWASAKGHIDIVKVLLAKGAEIDAKDAVIGFTPLISATKYGHTEIVKVLLDKEADVNAKDKNGDTTLMYAAKSGYTEIIELLLFRGADVNTKNKDGETALLYAARGGNVKIVEVLLSKDAEANAKNNNSVTPLMYVAENGHTEIAQVLLANGAEVNAKNNNGRTALFFAAQNGYVKIVEVLLTNGADVNVKANEGVTVLMCTSENGHAEIVQALLVKGADVNAKGVGCGMTALMCAAKNGHTKIVEALLSKGANLNARDKCGQTALFLAAQNGHTETVHLLKQARIKK